ncbi:hypothetical protein EVAR_95870_1 [Eumeta japonica]|uniref:Uncharacterized protein n=1 Tax=Eumeta variegata TaxID=151549 RepID=A0A4C1VJY3_EUMVA|nr:hypothetical protein EVAR_95870_1 [Eumeta japonica]
MKVGVRHRNSHSLDETTAAEAAISPLYSASDSISISSPSINKWQSYEAGANEQTDKGPEKDCRCAFLSLATYKSDIKPTRRSSCSRRAIKSNRNLCARRPAVTPPWGETGVGTRVNFVDCSAPESLLILRRLGYASLQSFYPLIEQSGIAVSVKTIANNEVEDEPNVSGHILEKWAVQNERQPRNTATIRPEALREMDQERALREAAVAVGVFVGTALAHSPSTADRHLAHASSDV